jgi:hypothetical protein
MRMSPAYRRPLHAGFTFDQASHTVPSERLGDHARVLLAVFSRRGRPHPWYGLIDHRQANSGLVGRIDSGERTA